MVSGIGLLLAAVASWIVSSRILAPVRLVRRAAEEITGEFLNRRVPVRGRDDISAPVDPFDRLQRAFLAQREFVDDAGHELRTPITIVRGNLELMGDDPVERAEVVRLCSDELDRMSRIVEDLLVLARSYRPDFVRPTEIELSELTGDIDAEVRVIGDGRGSWRQAPRAWSASTPSASPRPSCSWRRTRYSTPGRRADPHRVGASRWRRVVLGDRQRPGSARRAPPRSSSGLPRTDGGAQATAPGAGLGLAIVRASAEARGGHVRLDSVPGRGARYTAEVPAEPPREAPGMASWSVVAPA